MYNNEHAGPAFSEFLETLGQRVRLKDFEKYRGGLDRKTDSTGLYSVYTHYRDLEVMFHVSTLLPFTPNNRKQLLRKRHIGNDIVTIVFQEPGSPPFSPKHIRSHFQHVFIVVQAVNPCTENTQYSVTVSRFRDVPMFGPTLPEGATFPKSKAFTDFLLAKAINGEIAALRSEKFSTMATRTRHEYLKDLALNHSSTTTIDTSTKFSLMGFSRSGKKDKKSIKFVSDSNLRGALSWPLSVHDAALQQNIDCVIGVSVDSVVVLEESSSSVIFAAPCKSVIGWTNKQHHGLRIFYHQGECLLIHLRPGTSEGDGEEIMAEIVARLSAVTLGAETQELVLRRNSAGLLGFNVQQDGVITEVEPYGLAAQSGLRQGARLVEICTVTLATLSQEQMVDLLKTSMTVTITIVPPHPDGAPRRGCNIPTCGFLLGGGEGDYENLSTPEELSRKHIKSRHNHVSRYDRSLSPPRSSNSSGYGTGSSSRSFTIDQQASQDYQEVSRGHQMDYVERQNQQTISSTSNSSNNNDYDRPADYEQAVEYTGTLSSTSSGHSSDPWTEHIEDQTNHDSPPPLPARSAQSAKRRGDLFQSSFHARGNATAVSHPSHLILNPNQPPPSSLTHPGGYVSSGFNSFPQTSLYPSSSPSPTSQIPSATTGLHIPNPIWSRPKHENDVTGDNANYAVPPPHPRPLHVTPPADSTNVNDNIAWRSERLNGNGRSCSLPSNTTRLGQEDNHSSTERLHPTRSEDELSASSGSPHTRRHVKRGNTTPLSASRNQSPRTVGIEARLRQAPTPRKNPHRNSANLGSSSLQEELFRLINPDYMSDSESTSCKETSDRPRAYSVSLGNPGSAASTSPGNHGGANSSLDRLSVKSGGSNSGSDKSLQSQISSAKSTPVSQGVSSSIQGSAQYRNYQPIPASVSCNANNNKHVSPTQPEVTEVVVLTARPATVISNSSANSSPATISDHKIEQKMSAPSEHAVSTLSHSTNVTTVTQERDTYMNNLNPLAKKNSLPCTKPSVDVFSNEQNGGLDVDQEWMSLVNTATKAIQKSGDILTTQGRTAPPITQTWQLQSVNRPLEDASGGDFEPSSLHDRVAQLERRLAAEQQRSEQLEDEVSQLRNENRKLQEDSRAAAQQLHQFTEWFFNTIEKS
ncbi:Signal-induced proliferation-associated 1-like protein 2 [Halocaridina rubra]|uniref:Signal-induced proliferation-associated 1-like protein 2 n=1 Tax=Halocaridina rubra TaxID=373956 RepID=A0AAN8XR32_HALRR